MKHYVYGFSFSTDRKLTQEEIMKISEKGSDAMKSVILENTEIDVEKHNLCSGVEER